VATACDDGRSCTVDDHCDATGTCVGTIQGLCCTPDFTGPADLVGSLQLGESGQPGEALDVDGNPATCAPPSNCSDGLDNSLALLADVANPQLAKAFANGSVNLVFEHRGFNANGTPYMLAFFNGHAAQAGCDPTTASCPYTVTADFLDADCQPLYGFSNARVVGTHLTAGGVGFKWPLDIPISAGVDLHVTVWDTIIDATVTLSGGKPVAMAGLLGGAVPKADMIAAVDALPDSVQLPAGMTKQSIHDLIDAFITNDIDTDGDGNLDAASIGLKFTASAATISGVQ
jgi:hypothetical protein